MLLIEINLLHLAYNLKIYNLQNIKFLQKFINIRTALNVLIPTNWFIEL